MERKVVQTIDTGKVLFDEDLYPRSNFQWQTSYDYAQSMKAGAKFPPITVAVLNKKIVLVDGKHRLEALKQLKINKVQAEIFTGWNKQKIFEEAVKRNIKHGRSLSPFEKRRIALKLRAMKYGESAISELIQVPMDKLENFVAQRLTNTITGDVIVKSEIKHLAGQTADDGIEVTQQAMYSGNQVSILKEVIRLLENDLINPEHKEVEKLLNRLRELLS